MHKRIFAAVSVILLNLCLVSAAYAGSPVEDLILKYESVHGAKDYKASGAAMSVGRTFLKKYPIAPLADDIDEMLILRMEKTSPDVKKRFEKDFLEAVKTYMYIGKQDTKQGVTDVYCLVTSNQIVEELIVYNPAVHALNCLRGNMDPQELMKIRKPVEE